MINKRSIWFLTLFSLIIVLSIYYVTMPSELLLNTNGNYFEEDVSKEEVSEEENVESTPTSKVEESSILVALRVEADEQMNAELEELKKIILDSNTSVDEKNSAYNKMKDLNIKKGEEEKIEQQILNTYQLKSFVKINNNQIRVVVEGSEHNVELANNIMRTVQGNFENGMYISVKFQG